MSSMSSTHQQKIDQIKLGDQNSEKTKIGGSKSWLLKLEIKSSGFLNRGIKTALKPIF
jgi:hypothetical protein